MNIILFGPYGSGKGTQGRILAEKYNLEMFDTGSELRKHIKNETELGKKIKNIIDGGELVSNETFYQAIFLNGSNEIVMEVVSSFIDNAPTNKELLFDGIPRTQEQADLLDALLDKQKIEVKRLFINVPRELSIARQVGRKTCQACGTIHKMDYASNNCSKCETKMEKRVENDESIAT